MAALITFILLGMGVILSLAILPKYGKYSHSHYKEASGNGFFKTLFDKGNYGEFLTFSYLEKLGGNPKLMTNLYIPKADGTTTEIDLVMLSQTGIYVFESKNYSGWIFGDEKNKNWTQSLPNKQKNRFFNPIWQNKGHINALKSVIEIDNDQLYKSYIVFSERCTLKKISITSPNLKVLKRNELMKTIKKDIESSPNLMESAAVNQLYLNLQQYTRAVEALKKSHIEHVQMKRL